MRILAIETSCDETAIAMADFSGTKKNQKINVLANVVSSQIKLHAKFGGVVPNLAKREHQKNLPPVLIKALREAEDFSIRQPADKSQNQKIKIKKTEEILAREPELLEKFKKLVLPLHAPDIDAIAVTIGPGLAPALWVGINFSKALAFIWNKPLLAVNHMEGHIYSAFLEEKLNKFRLKTAVFPALALLVSGGHTELVLMRGHDKYKIIGETLDDAAGEAFDKVARILGLEYPGGPAISVLAERKSGIRGPKSKIKLPRPMLSSKDFNFSFSGLKTAVLYMTRDLPKNNLKKLAPAVAREFQEAVVEVLVTKTLAAAKKHKVKSVLLGGGVSANKKLRENLARTIKKELPDVAYRVSPVAISGDNALMIALAAFFSGKKKKVFRKIQAEANLTLCPRTTTIIF